MPLEISNNTNQNDKMMVDVPLLNEQLTAAQTLSEKSHFVAIHAEVGTKLDESNQYLQKLKVNNSFNVLEFILFQL